MDTTEMMLPNIKVKQGAISEHVIVVGNPERAKMIGDLLDHSEELAYSREYRTINGYYKGKKITVASHGVGSPGAAVCFEELIKAGAKKIIRVGTAGSYTEELPPGSLIIADSAVRAEGLTKQLVPEGVPAVADFNMLLKLEEAAKKMKFKYGLGTIVTLDAFYAGPLEFPHMLYKESGALGAEMELAALYVIARLRGVSAVGIFALDGYAFSDMNDYNPHKDFVNEAIQAEIDIALETLLNL
ncbi:MAG: nucleoside phosphorylase [Bacillota bacterium]|uniref:nucleoside phosphorylase n=1 Tax=Paenibacillus maysiensis TaxID=1155954 RepID=UPI0004AFB159